MRFQRPEYLVFLLLFLLVYLLRWRIKSFVGHSLVHRLRTLPIRTSRLVYLPGILTALATLLISAALLDPVLSLSRVRVTTRGLNLVMLVDLSSSMLEYMGQNRYVVPGTAGVTSRTKLEAVKDAIRVFVRGRQGDRVGTIVFSERPYVVNPLTLDYSYVSDYLNLVDHRTLAGEGRTAIGEAVFAGLKLLRWKDPQGQSQGALLIFTDGENNAGRSLYEALEKARQEKARVWMIGIQIWYLADSEHLKEALVATGGRFFDVQDQEQLQQAYQTIDALERQQLVTERYVRDSPFYYPFIGAALVLLLSASLLKAFPYFIEVA